MRDKRFEHRYTTLKLTDVKKYLTRDQQEQLEDLSNAIADGRKVDGKQQVEGIYIERDWPEYQSASAALYNRISGKDIYKGHPNLADMMSTHVDSLIAILKHAPARDEDERLYILHEIQALLDIKAAIEAEKSNAL
uniref:Terminase small subunit n=1 Tax=Klebsiella phage vB_Kpn2-P2 TaxID=3230849 RepID=A0AAU8EGK7_9VIRU